MFDGIMRQPAPRPVPPRPDALDTRALLPLLRAQAADAALEVLAVATGANAVAAVRWLTLNWGAGADLRDPCHPARAAALDHTSPVSRLAEAQVALSTACWRYRAATGHDGLALARRVITAHYDASIADYALKPLTNAAATWAAFGRPVGDGALAPELLPSEPEPNSAERRAGAAALADWSLADPHMDGVAAALGTLLAACGGAAGEMTAPGVTAALAAVTAALQGAAAREVDAERMQLTLDAWAQATGGPRIVVNGAEPQSG